MKIKTAGLIGLAAVLVLGAGGCNRAQNQGPDPASANMAPAGQTEPVARNEAPVQNSGYEAQLSEAPAPPPPLPEYSQPECPGENYMWTPGYWAYSTGGYYWTPGAWVAAPYIGALWTPPWWGYSGNNYIWHAGYWGPYVGFYGGIDYGFGYTGRGFYGGYWQGGAFNYNRTVMNVNTTVVHNVYERRVSNYTPVNRVSYNGGNGGANLRPVASEEIALRARRMGPAPAQLQYQREAAANRAQFAAVNGGRPAVAAARPVAEREAAAPGERRGAEGEPFRKETPAVNARPEPRGGIEARGAAPPVNARPEPHQPVQRAPEPRQNPAAAREAQRAPRPSSKPTGPRWPQDRRYLSKGRRPSSLPPPGARRPNTKIIPPIAGCLNPDRKLPLPGRRRKRDRRNTRRLRQDHPPRKGSLPRQLIPNRRDRIAISIRNSKFDRVI